MATFIVISVLLATTLAMNPTTDTPCYGKGCDTWWTRVGYPNYPKFRGPSEEEARKISEMIRISKNELEAESELQETTVDHHRLSTSTSRSLPPPRTTTGGYTDFRFYSHSTGRPAGHGIVPLSEGHHWSNLPWEVNHQSDKETLDFSGKGFTGDDVKTFFDSISGTNRNVTKQLQRLLLSHNHIRYLPVTAFPVDLEYGLKELRLDDNPFFYLNSYTSFELSRLGNLKILSLARTGLSYFDSLYIPSLEELDLSGNRLTYVPQCLESLQNLRKLNMSGNHVTNFYFPVIGKLVNLRVLSFSSNGFKYIEDNAFSSLPSLHELYLNNNSLTSFTNMDFGNIYVLHISDNPWECSCHLISTALRPSSIIEDVDKLTCFDGDKRFLRKMISFTEEEIHRCRGKGDRFNYHEERFERVGFWIRRQLSYVPTILTFVWWVVVCVSLVLIVQHLWRSRRKVAQSVGPYNILDDKMII